MKKLMSVVMAVVFLCAIALPVFAADTPSPTPEKYEAPNGVVVESNESLGENLTLVVEDQGVPEGFKAPNGGEVAVVFEIHVEDAEGNNVEVKDKTLTVTVPKSLLKEEYRNLKYYQAVFVPQPEDTYPVTIDGDALKFTVTHFSQYAIIGSDTPFEAAQTPGTQAPGENGENTSPVTESFVYMMAIAAAAVVCVALAVVTARKASKSK